MEEVSEDEDEDEEESEARVNLKINTWLFRRNNNSPDCIFSLMNNGRFGSRISTRTQLREKRAARFARKLRR